MTVRNDLLARDRDGVKVPPGCGLSMKRTKLARSREDTCAKPTHENSTDASGVNGLYAAQASAGKGNVSVSPKGRPRKDDAPAETPEKV
jgi:hypothetical protein